MAAYKGRVDVIFVWLAVFIGTVKMGAHLPTVSLFVDVDTSSGGTLGELLAIDLRVAIISLHLLLKIIIITVHQSSSFFCSGILGPFSTFTYFFSTSNFFSSSFFFFRICMNF